MCAKSRRASNVGSLWTGSASWSREIGWNRSRSRSWLGLCKNRSEDKGGRPRVEGVPITRTLASGFVPETRSALGLLRHPWLSRASRRRLIETPSTLGRHIFIQGSERRAVELRCGPFAHLLGRAPRAAQRSPLLHRERTRCALASFCSRCICPRRHR